MKALRILLAVANMMAVAALLAIPIGKLFGVVEQQVDAAAVIGWLIFFVPLLASALALLGSQCSRPALTRPLVMIAMPGSFLVALLSLFTSWQGPPDFALIGFTTMVLLGLNVLALWQLFKACLESPSTDSLDTDVEG